MKSHLKSKTLWVARLLMLFGLMEQSWHLLDPYFGTYGGLALFLVGVLKESLRWITNEPIALKDRED